MRGVSVNGAEILAARTSRGLTQDDLARLAGVDVKTIRKAEQGKRLDLAPLALLAKVLNTDLKLLIAPSDEESGLQVSRREVIIQWHDAFEAYDMDAFLSHYQDDAVMRLPGGPSIPFNGNCVGKEAIRKAMEISWQMVHQKPITIEEMTILVSGDVVTLKGDIGIYAPSGELFYLPCLQTFIFRDLLIVDHQVEYDTLEFARQYQLLSGSPSDIPGSIPTNPNYSPKDGNR